MYHSMLAINTNIHHFGPMPNRLCFFCNSENWFITEDWDTARAFTQMQNVTLGWKVIGVLYSGEHHIRALFGFELISTESKDY